MEGELKADLAAALVKFQFEVPVIPKNRTAKIETKTGGSYSYKYADLADIWEAVRKPLSSNDLAVTQFLVGGEDGHTGIKTTVWHKSGQCISGTMHVTTDGKTAQEAGSLFTYYKRYALSAALGISTEEDDDGAAGNTPPPRASSTNPATDKQKQLIRDLATKQGMPEDAVDARLEQIKTSAEASEAISKLKGDA
jgi:hypothetical protein